MMVLAWDDLRHYEWMSTPVWVYDRQGARIRWANHAAVRYWEADDMRELCSRDLSDLSFAAATRIDALTEEVRHSGMARAAWVLHPRGLPKATNLTVRAITGPAGQQWLWVEGHRAEEERIDPSTLRGVEAVLHFSLAVAMFDLEGGVLMQNPAALRAFPQLADPAGNRFLSLLESRAEAERIWRGGLENGADQGERLFSSHPKPRWYAYSLHRVIDPVTGQSALLFSAQDVSERVMSEQKFRVLFEQSANPMMLFHPITGTVSDCNRATAQALRLPSRKQLINGNPEAFYPVLQPDGRSSREKAAEIAEHTLKRGWHRFEWMFRRADGGELLVEITLSPVQLGGEELLLGVWYDLSFRRLIERQLMDAKEAAEAASRAKSLFLANMSHEIRTPLNAIFGMTNLLMQTQLTAEQREWLDMVRFSSEGLVEIVGDILDFSRIEAGKLDLETRVFDLRALIAKTVELLRFKAEEKNLLLGLTMDTALPRWVEGDEARLRQVLVNLLGNAVKFTMRGSVSLAMRMMSDEAGVVRIRAEVRDTGIGIAPAKLSAIFDPFSQADDSISRRYGGSGLGLTISRRLLHAMGGNMEVESALGQGSLFSFEVPLRLAPAPDRIDDEERDASPRPARALHILLAEDNHINQRLAVALLEQAGHRVDLANNGEEAVDRFRQGKFDLVLMDMQMPEMDGLQATRTIRALEGPHRTPIVAMTANVLPEDRERCFAAGMDDFLTKPIALPRLHAVLQRVMDAALADAEAPPEEEGVHVFELDAALSACGGSIELLEDLADLFQQEWPARRQVLIDAFESGDTAMLARTAHTLKGSFGALASTAGADAALAVDTQAKRGELVREALSVLCETGDALCVALAEWRRAVAGLDAG